MNLFSIYSPRYPKTLVYMLQNTEYQAVPYLKWLWRVGDFRKVMYRRNLDVTKAAQLLLRTVYIGMAVEILVGLLLVVLGFRHMSTVMLYVGLLFVAVYPVIWAHVIIVPLWLGDLFIVQTKRRHVIAQAENVFAQHPGIKVAVVGSYGKTSMKELLATVLGQGFKVAASPGNKNVPISHGYFSKKLTGSEDILIIEYGEGAPGDVARLAQLTHPTHAVITGVAPAHLDHYKTLKAAGQDIFSVADFMDPTHVYVNKESALAKPFLKEQFKLYGVTGALGWKVSNVHVDLSGTSFVLKHGSTTLKLKSGLLGLYHVGALAFVAAFAHDLGMSADAIVKAISATKPHEHRMQPYQLAGAWIIDDTYNGNIEGIRAGTELLKELPAKRKIYVTPGLVDQGEEKQAVHEEMGKLIAVAGPDIVVLMQNSATEYVKAGLEKADYKGELRIETDPLRFYTNLNQFVAVGDIVMLQNDWPDNYN